MICQCCGVEAPTKYVSFHQNIGMLFARHHKTIRGQLCKSCIHKMFWKFTGTNLVAGWWGTISMIVTPCFIVNNVVRYVGCLRMPAAGPNAKRPALDEDSVNRLSPYKEEIFARMNRGETFGQVSADISKKAGVTPGQVLFYSQGLIRAAQAARAQQAQQQQAQLPPPA